MSKLFLLFSFIFFISSRLSLAQNDPLNWTDTIKVKSENIFILWGQETNGVSPMVSHQKVIKYILGSQGLPPQKRTTETNNHMDQTANLSGNQQMDVAAGFFINHRIENAVAAWEGPNQTIQIMIPHFDTTADLWSSTTDQTITGPVVPYGAGQRGRIYVRTGDFLGNGLDQFVLAYQGADSTIHLEVYDVDDSLHIHLISSIHDEKLFPLPITFARFSVTTGDLNGDGKDEIILDAVEQNYNGQGNWAIYAKVYEVNGSSILPEAKRFIFREPKTYQIQAPEFGITAGQFKMGSADQLALVSAANQSSGNNAYLFIHMLQASQDLKTLIYDSLRVDSTEIGTSGSLTDFSITSGDLNDAGRDELVFDLDDEIYVYSTDDSLNLTFKDYLPGISGGAEDDQLSYDFIAVGDLDESGSGEVVVEKDIYGNGQTQYLQINAYGLSQDLTTDSVVAEVSTDTSVDNGTGSYYHSALALGTFNGNNFRIGKPMYSQKTILQPIVILNAPPVHYDIFNDTTYDIDNCFNGMTNNFNAKYIETTTNSVEVQTQVHNDWGIGAGVDVSGTAGEGVQLNFEVYAEGKLGANFDNTSTSGNSETITSANEADIDDYIFGTISLYKMWDYPVYYGDNDTAYKYILIVEPTAEGSKWFPSKDPDISASTYIPDHEVGNILSYGAYNSVTSNPDVIQNIYPVLQKQYIQWTLDGTSQNHGWDLKMDQFTANQADTTWSTSFAFKIQTTTVVEGNFDKSNMSTQTISVSTGIDLQANLGKLDTKWGDIAGYTVTPYAYRAKSGALEINYTVDPNIAAQGFPPTWWQEKYGNHPDPTFILPWLYDPEKGIQLTENATRYQTHDIFFSNDYPQPGDNITITARVRNFSLISTSMPVTVKFYVGVPDSGGTIITDINGVDSTMTTSDVTARSWSDATLKWKYPSGLPAHPRIYAVLDPSNLIHEVHEHNNKGFNVLGLQPSITGIMQTAKVKLPNSPVLYQSYPNPFNPTTRIDYSIPKTALVKLIVYNILGQKVKTLFYGEEGPGKYSVNFNGEELASGVYFYRLQAGSYAKTKKMILLK